MYMNKDYEFLIAGGDLRQIYMEKYLKGLGYRVRTVFLTPCEANTKENLKNIIYKYIRPELSVKLKEYLQNGTEEE